MPEEKMTMISETLQRLNSSGRLSARQIAHILKVSESQAYRYISGHTPLAFVDFQSIFSFCGRKDVQADLLATVTEGTPWLAEPIDADLDINGDGDINTNDILDGAIKLHDKLGRMLTTVRGEIALGMSRLRPERAQKLCELSREMKQLLTAVEQVACRLSSSPPTRPSSRLTLAPN